MSRSTAFEGLRMAPNALTMGIEAPTAAAKELRTNPRRFMAFFPRAHVVVLSCPAIVPLVPTLVPVGRATRAPPGSRLARGAYTSVSLREIVRTSDDLDPIV